MISTASADRDQAEGRTKAIVLLSGGLDSTLAIALMLEQGIEVTALNFKGPFCTCSPRKNGGCHLAAQVTEQFGVELTVMAKGLDYLKMVQNPRFGRGRGLNPCIDCRIYMLRKAAELMTATGAAFVVTGEVLGQRPMSQRRKALELIERESGLSGKLLRPLSAQAFEPTIAEQTGIVDRAKLLKITGRSRSEQLAQARERQLSVFGCPAGGCLLTDPIIARRLEDVFTRCVDWDMRDARMATFGKHFRLHEHLKVVLGRDESENDRLIELGQGFPIVAMTVEPGPVAVLRGKYAESDLETVSRLIRRHAKKVTVDAVVVRLQDGDRVSEWTAREAATAEDIERWLI